MLVFRWVTIGYHWIKYFHQIFVWLACLCLTFDPTFDIVCVNHGELLRAITLVICSELWNIKFASKRGLNIWRNPQHYHINQSATFLARSELVEAQVIVSSQRHCRLRNSIRSLLLPDFASRWSIFFGNVAATVYFVRVRLENTQAVDCAAFPTRAFKVPTCVTTNRGHAPIFAKVSHRDCARKTPRMYNFFFEELYHHNHVQPNTHGTTAIFGSRKRCAP